MSRTSLTDYSQHSHPPSRHRPPIPSTGSAISVSNPETQDLLFRPESEQLCELHVYKVPLELWRGGLNNILNNVVTETVSIGIIRIPPDLRLCDIRTEIMEQLQVEDQQVPQDYVFLRSVGRSLTRLRGKQERQLKAKHFLPPVAFAPELYILEATPEIRDALAISERSSQSPPMSRRTSPSHTHRGYPNSYRNGYQGDSDSDRSHKTPFHSSSPPVNKYQTLPQIDHATTAQRYIKYNPNPELNDPYGRQHDPYSKPNQDQYNKSNHDPYASDSKSNPDHYADRRPKDEPYNTRSTPNDNSHKQNEPFATKPQQEFYQKPEQEKDVQPETKVVTEAFRSADLGQGQGRSSPSQSPQPPPRSAEKGRDRRHDDDSGVAGFTPEDEFNRRYRENDGNLLWKTVEQTEPERLGFGRNEESETEGLHRVDDLNLANNLDTARWDSDEEERRRRAENDRRRQEEEEKERREREEAEKRRRREENERIERLRREEEEKRRKLEEEEAQKRLKEEQERIEEEERQRTKRIEFQDEPSTPDYQERDTESARQRRQEEKQRLLQEIEEARRLRQSQEKEREELVRRAKTMQHKTTNRRNEARDIWKKKYFEEKKKTAPMEESRNRSEQELEALHRRLMNALEGPKEKNLKLANSTPSTKNNYVIQCTKLQHEIEDLQRRVENAKMKLTAEMKLRNQAQGELRALRAELTQRKTSLTQNRQQQIADLSPYTARRGHQTPARPANNLYGF